jgi:Flp pilus assembly protein TadG
MNQVKQRARGQIFLEFALVMPLCLMMFAAMVDMGLYLHRYLSIQTAVREGISAAARGKNDDHIRSVVATVAGGAALKASDIQVVRRESDPQLASLDVGNGATMSLKDQMKGYESIEVRVVTRHDYLVPIVFQGQSWANITVSVKTVRAR